MKLIRPAQAADILGIHTNTLRNWAGRGLITEIRMPTGHRRFNQQEIENLAQTIQPIRGQNDSNQSGHD